MTDQTPELETPAVRVAAETGPQSLSEALSPSTEATTPAASPPRSRRRRPPSPNLDLGPETDPELPPEPTSVEEATGPRRSRTTSQKQSRVHRASLKSSDAAVDFGDEDAPTSAKAADVINKLADAGQAGAKRKGPATAANWEEFLTVLLGFLSMLYVWWLVSGFEVPKREQDSLMLTEDEAEGMARPMARILARSWVNASYGKNVLGASDYVVLAIVVAEYTKRTAPYLKRRVTSALPRRQQRPPTSPVRNTQEDRNGHVDAAASRAPFIYPAQGT